jgi:hypothetical protein
LTGGADGTRERYRGLGLSHAAERMTWSSRDR